MPDEGSFLTFAQFIDHPRHVIANGLNSSPSSRWKIPLSNRISFLIFSNEKLKLITTLHSRCLTWITPCKRSAARGKVTAHSPGNSVGVQPATGLLVSVHCVPRVATLSGVARGYPSLSPTDFVCYKLFISRALMIAPGVGCKKC